MAGDGGAARSRLQTEERRRQLLEVGLRLFGERGYEALSIDQLAQAAGVSKGLLYHYFGGKKAFYVACVELAAERLVEAIRPDPALPSIVQVSVGVMAYLNFVQEHRRTYVALVRSGWQGGGDGELLALVDRTRNRIGRMILEAIEVSPDAPAFRLAMRSWLGAVEVASLEWLERGDVSRRGLMRLMLAGLYAHLSVASGLAPEEGYVPDPVLGRVLMEGLPELSEA